MQCLACVGCVQIWMYVGLCVHGSNVIVKCIRVVPLSMPVSLGALFLMPVMPYVPVH